MLPDSLRPSYEDPQLWRRLGPKVERLAELAEIVLTHKARNYEDYVHHMGELKALRWVVETSHNLNEAPPMRQEPEDDD